MKHQKLFEDINTLVNESPVSDRMSVVSDVNDYRELGKSGSSDRRPTSTESLKSEAIKVYNGVKQRIENLIKNKRYNLVISAYKRLAEELELQEHNYFANKNRVSKDFRHDDRIDNETKNVLKKFEALSTEQQNKFLKIVSSKTKMNPKVADDLATQ